MFFGFIFLSLEPSPTNRKSPKLTNYQPHLSRRESTHKFSLQFLRSTKTLLQMGKALADKILSWINQLRELYGL